MGKMIGIDLGVILDDHCGVGIAHLKLGPDLAMAQETADLTRFEREWVGRFEQVATNHRGEVGRGHGRSRVFLVQGTAP